MTENAHGALQRALKAIVADRDFLEIYCITVKEAEGLDIDFPELDFDGPVGRLHMMTARLREAGIKQEPELANDLWLQRTFPYSEFEMASASGEDK